MPEPCDLDRRLRRPAEGYALAAREVLGGKLVSVARGGPRFGRRPARGLPGAARGRVQAALRPLWERGFCAGFTGLPRTEAEAACFDRMYPDMVEEAVLLCGRDRFFAGAPARLRALGARRRRPGDVWYWDLRPDFRPGNVIEL